MQDEIEKALAAHADVYADPKEDRIKSLQARVMDLDFDGLHLGAPDTSDARQPGIPVVALSGTTMDRNWDVNGRQNSVLVAIDLDRAITRTWPLYPPPAKKLKPVPKGPKPKDLSTTAKSFGCRHAWVGGGLPDGLPPGDYALSLLEWDRTSNIRKVTRLPKPDETPDSPRSPIWNWSLWAGSISLYKARPESPAAPDPEGIALTLAGPEGKVELLGSLAVTAKRIHVNPTDPKPMPMMQVRAAVLVDLLQFSKDQPIPERITVQVPIQGPVAQPGQGAKPGEMLKGWFALPLAGLQRKEETVVYAFVDGFRAGPVKIAALKP